MYGRGRCEVVVLAISDRKGDGTRVKIVVAEIRRLQEECT